METKLNFTERQNLNTIKNQLASMYIELSEEWQNDKDKNGYVRLHSKTKQCMDKTIRAFNDITWLLNHMDIEL